MGHLEEGITAESVGQIVSHGQNFLDDAPSKFWESVESHGEALLNSKDFLHLQKATVATLLRRNLEVDETVVYAKAVAWAKAQCARKKQRSCDAQNILKELEGVLQLVRFPTMSADEFSRGPGTEEVLSAEEKVELFKWFLSRIPQKLFPNTLRYIGANYVCERFESKYGGGFGGYDADNMYAVDLQVDRAIRVTGFGIYGQSCHGFGYDRRNYKVNAELSVDDFTLATKEVNGSTNQSQEIILVNFDKPIKLEPGKYYTASVAGSGLPTCYGDRGASTKTVATKKGNVVFSFKQSTMPSARNGAREGQIPQILFRV